MNRLRKAALFFLSAAVLLGNLISGQAAMAAEGKLLFALERYKVLSLEFEGNVSDSSVKANHGTIQGTNYAYVDGVNGGKALKLNGGTYLNLGKSGTLQPADLTLSFWLKPNEKMTGEHMIMWNKTVWYSDGWYLSSENDNKPLAISLGSSDANKQPYKVSVTGSRADFFPVDRWTHVAITYDSKSKQVIIYRNGIKQQTAVDQPLGVDGADGIITADDTTQKSIGYNGPQYNGAFAKYALDDFQLYSAAASYEDIISLYEDQSGTPFDHEALARTDLDAISLPTRTISKLTLPTEGVSGSAITWTSGNDDVIEANGTVHRPGAGQSDAAVTLTAAVTSGNKTVTREFVVIVPSVTMTESLQDVEMSNVVLTDRYYMNAFDKEVDYLMSLSADKLLSAFRTTSGLTAKDTVYGGWENTEIRGHTLGHYLSAISTAYANASGQSKADIKERLDYIIDELALVQEANGNGYVSAFPDSFLDRVENGQGVWVPWYTMHKILAGLVSAAKFGDNDKALDVAEGLGEYIYDRTSKWNAAMKDRVLRVEYGGMNDSLYDLYALTGNDHYLKAAEKFDELTLFDSLYNNIDVLNGKHANTMIPKVIGALKRYTVLEEADSEQYYLQVAVNFWDMVVNHHSYVTGGNSENEHFGEPDILDAERTNVNNETCNVYNMLKLSRELYKITKDKKYADYYENAFTNAIMASQHPETGMSMYFQPMATGFFKVFSSALFHFWCCTGTGMENFTKLTDSIYFTAKNSVFVNLYLSSILTLPDKNLQLTQQSQLPSTGAGDASNGNVTFTVHTTGNSDTSLHFRIPDWAADQPVVKMNGTTVENYTVEDGYIVLKQNWTDGTVISLDFAMSVVLHELQDNPNSVALKYGPVVLSAGLGTSNMTTSSHGVNVLKPNKDSTVREFITITDNDIDGWKQNIAEHAVKSEGKLEFTLKGTDADDGVLTFTPHFQRYEDRYGIYFELVTPDSPSYQQSLLKAKEAGRAEAATVSFVIVANDQYELAANRQTVNSTVGTHNGKPYRDARANGWFSYDMEVAPGAANYLFTTYFSGDVGRSFDIYIDDNKLINEQIVNRNPGDFYNQTRKIPDEWVKASRTKTITEADETGNLVEKEIHYVTVKFASTGGFVGGLFDIFRVITDYNSNPDLKSLSFDQGTLSRSFDPAVTEYTLTVPSTATTVHFSASPAEEYGLVYAGDVLIDDKLERAVALHGDATELVLTAKAEDHATAKKYTIHIVRSDAIQEDMVFWYKLDEGSGTTAADSSGHGRDGILTGEVSWGQEGLQFNGTNGYIKVPNHVMQGVESTTVAFKVFVEPSQGDPHMLFGFGNTGSDGVGNGYLYMSGNSFRAGMTLTNWTAEQNASKPQYNLPRGEWKHVAYTLENGTAVLYEDGREVGRNTEVTLHPSLIGGGMTTANYIGRSVYNADKYFKGKMQDFRMYNRALDASEVARLAGDAVMIADVKLDGLKADPIIDKAAATIKLYMERGTDLTALAPSFTVPAGSTILPSSGTPVDLSKPVIYTVFGPEGESKQWTIEARLMNSPILPGLYADPHISEFDGRYYIYPTTDGFPGWSGTQFKAFSSDDLIHWTDHGVILDVPADTTWATGRAWAPAAAEKNGKYYFYFTADTNIGVAVADSPVGPFKDSGKPLVASGSYSGQMIDPMVFNDDDGQSYLYFGNGRGYVAKLNEDMISLNGTPQDITPSGFREGAFVFKRDNKYYYMWSENDTRDEDYRVAYGIGDSPMGPFTKQGVILEKDLSLGIKGTGHHSVVQVPGKDEFYMVYHRFAIPSGDGTHRETTIDKMEFNADGTIKKVIPTLESIEPLKKDPATAKAVLVGPGLASAGSTFEVVYGLGGIERPWSAQDMTFTYDPARLEFISAQSIDEDKIKIADYREKGNEIRVLIVQLGDSPSYRNGELLKLTFKVKDDAAAGQADIAVSKLIAADSKGDEFNVEGDSWSLLITKVYGDLNQDDKVSIGDLAILAKAYGMKFGDAGWDAVKAGDLNGDGVIDIVDLSAMARLILDWTAEDQ